ncbi:43kDa postsynaptic protein [Parasponia andersonii]|uniref:RING-type E3 ubiquitin transferase n=1 Tax=Parasponia andersonii TaxID=3476 RepID=A0A2P5AKZ1_PARAD|nr:43kDa postsynaptic protein [Parasponia andersonii]
MAITRRVITEFKVDAMHESTIEVQLDVNSGTTSFNPIVQLSIHPNSIHHECHRHNPYENDQHHHHTQTLITGPTTELRLSTRDDDLKIVFSKLLELLASLQVSLLKKIAISVRIFDGIVDNLLEYNRLYSCINISKWVMSVDLEVSSVILYSDEYWREYCHMVPASGSSLTDLVRRTLLDSSENLTCTICLEQIDKGFTVTRMPCMHEFHDICLVRWLCTSHYCPLCRFKMPT